MTSAAVKWPLGYNALISNTSGNNNTAVGMTALDSNATGNNNTASGFGALFNSTGSNNVAVGRRWEWDHHGQ